MDDDANNAVTLEARKNAANEALAARAEERRLEMEEAQLQLHASKHRIVVLAETYLHNIQGPRLKRVHRLPTPQRTNSKMCITANRITSMNP